MRLFTALELDTESKQRIYNWKDQHLSYLAKEIPSPNYHITLRFFGEVATTKLEQLDSELSTLHESLMVSPFTLTLDQIAFWPRVGIIWIGPKQWPNALSKLANAHIQLGCRLGVKRPKQEYQPHISLYRKVEHFLSPPDPPMLDLRIQSVALYESQLGGSINNATSAQPYYQVVNRWTLYNKPKTGPRVRASR